MKTINIKTTDKSYDVLIGSGLLCRIGDMIPMCNVTLITDDIVDKLYADTVIESLRKNGRTVYKFVFPNGEKSKTIATYQAILEFMTEHEMTRSDIVIALGGGVVGDIAGFAAATYLRGIKFISVPTTLLAAVDSSVGGKTAVNLNAGKNQAGAFWQPEFVICDTDTLKTLNHDILADGYAEIIKYGMICDLDLLNQLSPETFMDNAESIISRCIEIKSIYVADDVNDKGIRQILNFGHTIGHAIEKLSDYKITHGHAVAIGMVIITRSAVLNGLCPIDCLSLLLNKLNQFNLPLTTEYTAEQLANAAMSDKKRSGGDITLVIPVVSGECKLHKIKIDELAGFITSESIAVIKPHKLHGKINAIPSKSDIHRELICRFLAGDELSLFFDSDDVKATYNCLMNIRNGNNIIDCGESGTTLRFMLPLISALGLDCKITIKTSGRLSERPINELHEICSGKLTSGTYKISGDITSQYVSALLFVLPILDGDSKIELTSTLESSAYVDMTLQKMKKFGVIAEKTDYGYFIRGNQRYVSYGQSVIEGDWSSGSVWLSVGVECDGLDIDSLQPDKEILNIINKIGSEIDMSQFPDIVPITAVIAAVGNGTTVLKNIGRLRYKESDRLNSVTQALKSLGADVRTENDSIIINGVSKLHGGIVSGFNDHRIVMAIAAASTMCDGDIIIIGADSVKKSYPDFFSDFNKLGGEACVI